MLGVEATSGSHFRIISHTFHNEAFGIFAGLNIFQRFTHRLTAFLVDDARAGHVFAIFGIIGNRVVHVCDAAFEHQIDNQLQLMQTFEISHLRRVTRFDQCFETGLNQFNRTTAQHRLFAEQIGFGFVTESGLDDAGTTAANRRCVRQANVFSRTGSVLLNRN